MCVLRRAAQSPWLLPKSDAIPITQRPSDQYRLLAEYELEAVSSIRSLPPSSIAPSSKGFVHKIREGKKHEEEESMC